MILDFEKAKLRRKFETDIYYEGDVIRWKRSGNAIPEDIMYFWRDEGLIGDAEITATAEARSADLSKALERYREARENMTDEQRAEEAAERRAAFGSGQRVINVFTGEEYTT